MDFPFLEIFYIAISAWLIVQVIGHPFTEAPESLEQHHTDQEILMDRKNMAVQGLKELEMDYEMGKIDDREYKKLRQQLESEAIELLKELDREPESGEE